MLNPNPLPVPGGAKPRYELLDGLRGVAAVLVVWYHFFEPFHRSDLILNHGYLGVDFFFVLSGFVIGYAYDGRWKRGMTVGLFMLRRVIRLQPMVVLSVILGAVVWLLQGSVKWDGTPVPLDNLLVALLLGLVLIPVWPGAGADVRGNGEMFPLNGPSWSLFFEYIGSFLYAVILHRLSIRWLRVVVIVSALCLAACAFTHISGGYDIGIGWTLDGLGFFGGFFRLSFSFSVGLLISRTFRPRRIRGAFWICSFIITVLLAWPYIGGPEPSMWNAAYDSIAAILIFPALVYIGACGTTTDSFSTGICNFLGEISYPVYIVHYPVMYLFYAWVWSHGYSFAEVWPVCCGLFAGIILLAWISLRFYDAPVRAWLASKFLSRKGQA